MSLNGGSARMNNARRQLVLRFEQVRRRWDDPNSHRLENECVKPWDTAARQAARAMTEMAVLLQKVRADCE